jgi:solute carrier family 25 citrate transporter 1
MWGVVPANIAYFGGYEVGKRCVPGHWGIGGDMAIGAVAQVLAGIIYTPIDVVKERMQVQGIMRHAYSYKNAAAAFSALQSGPGGAAGLFKGYWITNSVWLPWNTLYIAGYEQLKRLACKTLGCSEARELPAWTVATCSAVAAAAAAVVTHPADVVKTRLQVLSATAEGRGLTARSLARDMLAVEGVAVFWQGLFARVLNIAPGCAISWMMFEVTKKQLNESRWLQGR